MTMEINTLTTPFIFNVSVNCYLVRTGDGFILIDTGRTNKRGAIEKELEERFIKEFGSIEAYKSKHGIQFYQKALAVCEVLIEREQQDKRKNLLQS